MDCTLIPLYNMAGVSQGFWAARLLVCPPGVSHTSTSKLRPNLSVYYYMPSSLVFFLL
jgi:hypothetical protein